MFRYLAAFAGSSHGLARKVAALVLLAGTSLILAGPAFADVTSNPDGPVVAVQDPGNSLDLFWQMNGTPYQSGQWHYNYLEDGQPYGTANGVSFFRVSDNGAYSAPSLATDGGSTVIAVRGPDNSLDFYWSPNSYWSTGIPSFKEETVAAANTTFSAPQLIVDGNRVDIVAEGGTNTLDFYSVLNGQNFNPSTPPTVVGGPGSTFSAPSVTANGNGLNIAAVGYEGLLDFYWSSNGGPFSGANVVNPYGFNSNFSAPSITSNGESATIVDEGADYSLNMWSNWNGTSQWYFGPGYFTSSGIWVSTGGPDTAGFVFAAPRAAWTEGELSVVTVGLGGSVDYFRQDTAGLHYQQAFGYGTTTYGAQPTITPNNGSVNIQVQDSQYQVFYGWQRLGAPGWGQEQWSVENCPYSVCQVSS
jgi:hypothetical protein